MAVQVGKRVHTLPNARAVEAPGRSLSIKEQNIMPSNGFTDRAQEALRTAQEIVQQKRHSQLDVEHILLALLKPRDGLVSKIVEKLNGDSRLLARRLDEQLNSSPRLYSSYSGLAQI